MATPGQWYPSQGKQSGFRQCKKCSCDINLATANCCLNCGSPLRPNPSHQGAPSFAQVVGRGGGGQAGTGGKGNAKAEAGVPGKPTNPEKLSELAQLHRLMDNLEEGDFRDSIKARIDVLRKEKLEQQPHWKQDKTVLQLIEKKKAIDVCQQRQVDSDNSIQELQKVKDKAREEEAGLKTELAQLEEQAKQIAAAKLPAAKDYFPMLSKVDPAKVKNDGLQQLIDRHGSLALEISQMLGNMGAEQEAKKDVEMSEPGLPIRQGESQRSEASANVKRPTSQKEEVSKEDIMEEAKQFLGEEYLAQLSPDEAQAKKDKFAECYARLSKKAKTG